jgi:hypothetical protein
VVNLIPLGSLVALIGMTFSGYSYPVGVWLMWTIILIFSAIFAHDSNI